MKLLTPLEGGGGGGTKLGQTIPSLRQQNLIQPGVELSAVSGLLEGLHMLSEVI